MIFIKQMLTFVCLGVESANPKLNVTTKPTVKSKFCLLDFSQLLKQIPVLVTGTLGTQIGMSPP